RRPMCGGTFWRVCGERVQAAGDASSIFNCAAIDMMCIRYQIDIDGRLLFVPRRIPFGMQLNGIETNGKHEIGVAHMREMYLVHHRTQTGRANAQRMVFSNDALRLVSGQKRNMPCLKKTLEFTLGAV